MAMPARAQNVNILISQLPEVTVVWDDRPNGGDAMYTARKAWLAPFKENETHRLTLQDDVILCNNFKQIVNKIIEAQQDLPITLLSFYDTPVKVQTSPYYRTNYLHGPGIILPRKFIKPCFDWIDTQTNEKLLPHDDLMITEYFRTHHIPMLTVFPNIIQHPDDDTLLPYSYRWKRIRPGFKEEPVATWGTKEIQKI